MVRFKTQKEVSEYLGKNPNDRSLISRLISKGIVERISWGYEVKEQWSDEITRLREEVDKLKKELENRPISKSSDTSSGDIEEYKVNCEYRHKQFQIMKRWYELVIEYTYPYASKGQKIEKSEYNEQLSLAVREQLEHEFWKLE